MLFLVMGTTAYFVLKTMSQNDELEDLQEQFSETIDETNTEPIKPIDSQDEKEPIEEATKNVEESQDKEESKDEKESEDEGE